MNSDNEQTTVVMEPVVGSEITFTSKNDEPETMVQGFDDLLDQVETLSRNIKQISTEMKTMKKKCAKVIKTMSKGKRRKTVVHEENGSEVVERKEPSGFVSPIEISAELADFLGIEHDQLIPRTVVTKQIIKYVKDNKLNNATNGRQFDLTDSTNPKAQALKELFGVSVGNEVGYFNLQAFLKHHFKPSNKKLKQQQALNESSMLEASETQVQSCSPVEKVHKRKIRLGKK